MHFLRVNVTFDDIVIMIHDGITTATLFPNTAKFILAKEIIKLNKTYIER